MFLITFIYFRSLVLRLLHDILFIIAPILIAHLEFDLLPSFIKIRLIFINHKRGCYLSVASDKKIIRMIYIISCHIKIILMNLPTQIYFPRQICLTFSSLTISNNSPKFYIQISWHDRLT